MRKIYACAEAGQRGSSGVAQRQERRSVAGAAPRAARFVEDGGKRQRGFLRHATHAYVLRGTGAAAAVQRGGAAAVRRQRAAKIAIEQAACASAPDAIVLCFAPARWQRRFRCAAACDEAPPSLLFAISFFFDFCRHVSLPAARRQCRLPMLRAARLRARRQHGGQRMPLPRRQRRDARRRFGDFAATDCLHSIPPTFAAAATPDAAAADARLLSPPPPAGTPQRRKRRDGGCLFSPPLHAHAAFSISSPPASLCAAWRAAAAMPCG